MHACVGHNIVDLDPLPIRVYPTGGDPQLYSLFEYNQGTSDLKFVTCYCSREVLRNWGSKQDNSALIQSMYS